MSIDPDDLPEGLRRALDKLREDKELVKLAEGGALGDELNEADRFPYADLKETLGESVRRVQYISRPRGRLLEP